MIVSDATWGRTPVTSSGVVVAGNRASVLHGVTLLAQGGSAVDALVGAAFMAFVHEPAMCGVGGYGHMAVYEAETGDFYSVDHGVRAPIRAHAEMFELDPAARLSYLGAPGVVNRRNELGCLSVAVPGAVAGLCEAHARWGKLTLGTVLTPAVDEAREGLVVSHDLMTRIAHVAKELKTFPDLAEVLLRDGVPLVAQNAFDDAVCRLDLAELSRTFAAIAENGKDAFYRGRIAEKIVQEIARGGGILAESDLATYQATVTRESPREVGGVWYASGEDTVAYEALNIVNEVDLTSHDWNSSIYYHYMAEALGCAFVDNLSYWTGEVGAESSREFLSSVDLARGRALGLKANKVLPRPIAPWEPWPLRSEDELSRWMGPSVGGAGGTSMVVAGDQCGNLAALCTTLETGFGSMVLVPGTGIILNNAMMDFDPRPFRANSIGPRKRPLFGAPAIVAAKDGKGVFAASGSGGYRIEAAVLHTMMGALLFGQKAQTAADAPRVHSQGGQTLVDVRMDRRTIEELVHKGHIVKLRPQQVGLTPFGRVGAISRRARTGQWCAAASPVWSTAAAGV